MGDSRRHVASFPNLLRDAQKTFDLTGGLMAGLFTSDGELTALRKTWDGTMP
jgi:formate dehydrogenase assembly factor FdhD